MTRKPLPSWTTTVVAPATSIRDALVVMGKGRRQIALVADADGRLLGTITDGDVRRAILNNVSPDQPVTNIMYANPFAISPAVSRTEQIALMREREIHHLPIVSDAGKLIGLVSIDELLIAKAETKPNVAVLLVGGLGSRLRPLTERNPKPLLPVGGRPLLETIVQQLRDHGIRNLYFAVNYLADEIKAHFGDGSHFDVQIAYLEEDRPLGTAGPLGLLPETPAHPFIVMNGDILTNVDFSGLLTHHVGNGAAATVATRTYEFEIPFGVIENDGYRINAIVEKPKQRHQVSAGIYVLDPGTLAHVTPGTRLDMPDLLKDLIGVGETVLGFPIHEYWIDIGHPESLHQAAQDYADVFG